MSKLLFIQIMLVVGLLASSEVFSQQEPYVKEPFFDDFEGPNVNTSVWEIATWREHGGQTSTSRCYTEDGYLKLIFINDPQKGLLSSAIQSRKEFLYGKWEARLKVSSVPGILNSFYTIDWNNFLDPRSKSDGTKQEIDIEFLTYTFGEEKGEVHFALHEAGKESFETSPDVALDFNPSDDFHVWGFDITPDHIEWFVDSTILEKYEYEDGFIEITRPYQIKMNSWSSKRWIKGPPEQGVECVYLIDWVRFTPHVPSGVDEPVQQESSLRVYPNPFQYEINFELLASKAIGEKRLIISDISGRVIYSKDIEDRTITWSGTDFSGKNVPAGLYFYQLQLPNNGETLKGSVLKTN